MQQARRNPRHIHRRLFYVLYHIDGVWTEIMARKKIITLNIGIVEIVLAVFILSFSGPFVRWAGLNTGAMTFMRTAIPSVILGFWLLIHGGIWQGMTRRKFFWLLIASSLNAVRLWLFFEAFRITSVGNAIIVLYSWPVFTALFGASILKESLTGRDIVFLGIAFIGMIVVYSGGEFSLDDDDFLGMTLMLISAVLYSMMIVLIRREKIERLQATFWQNLVGAIVYIPSFLGVVGMMGPSSWIFAGLNGLLVGTVGFALFFSALGRLPAAVVGHVSYLEVVFALIWGWAIFSEPVGWRHLLGGGFIILSMVVRAEFARRTSVGKATVAAGSERP